MEDQFINDVRALLGILLVATDAESIDSATTATLNPLCVRLNAALTRLTSEAWSPRQYVYAAGMYVCKNLVESDTLSAAERSAIQAVMDSMTALEQQAEAGTVSAENSLGHLDKIDRIMHALASQADD